MTNRTPARAGRAPRGGGEVRTTAEAGNSGGGKGPQFRRRVPFVFITGYVPSEQFPLRFKDVIRLEKPFNGTILLTTLAKIFGTDAGNAPANGMSDRAARESNITGNDCTLPIRLLPTPPTCRVLPGSGVKLCVGRCGDVARDAEQGTEGVERIEPPVEAEGEFVEVGLQVLVTDP